jgi:hypothetical protein
LVERPNFHADVIANKQVRNRPVCQPHLGNAFDEVENRRANERLGTQRPVPTIGSEARNRLKSTAP